MFKTMLAIDIGSRISKFAVRESFRLKGTALNPFTEREQRDRIVCEATCLVADSGGEPYPFSIGNEAERRRSSGRIYPVRDGSVANSRLLAIYLKRLACDITGKRNLSQIEPHLAVSRALGEMKMNHFTRTLQLAGFKSIQLHDAHLMGAIGAGIDVFKGRASMLVDIGAETVSCVAVANGGILWECVHSGGSSAINRAITAYFRLDHGVLIGDRMAEMLKRDLDKSNIIVDGRSCDNGLPVTVRADAEKIRTVVDAAAMPIVQAIIDSIKALQPDAVSDLVDTGLTLIGGGARMFGLEESISKQLGIPALVAENAETAVIDGLHECLFDNKRLLSELKQGYAVAADY